MATKSKKCTGSCGKTKAIAMFTKKASQSDGLNPWCQECAAAYRVSKKSGSTSAKKGSSVKKTNKSGSTKKMTKKPAKKMTSKKSKIKVPASSKKTARKTK